MFRGIKYRKYESERAFGVELEAGNSVTRQEVWSVITRNSHRPAVVTDWSQSHTNRYWHVKTDSTCGPKGKGLDYGVEVASYKACGLEDMLHIAEVAGRLESYGVQVNNNCGLHIHADISDFLPAQVGVLVGHWMKCEHFLFNCVPRHRSLNPYCRGLWQTFHFDPETQYDPQQVWEMVRPFDLCVFENPERRVALNLMNYATGLRRKRWSRRTIELRLPEGTFGPLHVKNWIRFFLNFVEYTKTRAVPDNITPCLDVAEAMRHCGLGHDDEFCIFSPGLHETRTWLLQRCVKYGGWLVGKAGWNDQALNILNFITQSN